jgi:hypothetical protein
MCLTFTGYTWQWQIFAGLLVEYIVRSAAELPSRLKPMIYGQATTVYVHNSLLTISLLEIFFCCAGVDCWDDGA